MATPLKTLLDDRLKVARLDPITTLVRGIDCCAAFRLSAFCPRNAQAAQLLPEVAALARKRSQREGILWGFFEASSACYEFLLATILLICLRLCARMRETPRKGRTRDWFRITQSTASSSQQLLAHNMTTPPTEEEASLRSPLRVGPTRPTCGVGTSSSWDSFYDSSEHIHVVDRKKQQQKVPKRQVHTIPPLHCSALSSTPLLYCTG